MLTTLQSTDSIEQSCMHDAINQLQWTSCAERAVGRHMGQKHEQYSQIHSLTHSHTHVEQLHAVQSE